jgi:hypothetical protein
MVAGAIKARCDELPAEALRTLGLLRAELPLKKAAALTAEIHGVKKNALYKYGLEHTGIRRLVSSSGTRCTLRPRSWPGNRCFVVVPSGRRAEGRKVRAPQGRVPGNAWGA